jgi:hypothetical protein
MKMSLAYMREAAQFLVEHGFQLKEEEEILGEVDGLACKVVRFDLQRTALEHLQWETVVHPQNGEQYFLRLAAFHGLSSFSFPLDSWKFRGHRLEVKFYSLPESGLGLSLVFDASELPAASP